MNNLNSKAWNNSFITAKHLLHGLTHSPLVIIIITFEIHAKFLFLIIYYI